MYLGIDGGGSKTEFVLVDRAGHVRARHQEGSLYYLEIGLDEAAETLRRGVAATLAAANAARADVAFAFVGVPAYGEDSALAARLDTLPARALDAGQYRCGNDMLCSWAGSLAGGDGLGVIAGTGSMAYGESGGHAARTGGWGELFSDEGSAYWIARQGLTLFSRMSDGRSPRGPLYDVVRTSLELAHDLDLCAHVYGGDNGLRSEVARFALMVHEAAHRGCTQSIAIYDAAASELAEIVVATRQSLHAPAALVLDVSYSGGVFNSRQLVLEPFARALERSGHAFRLMTPRFSPALGAAMFAARCHGAPLDDAALVTLAAEAAA
ncbi:MAG: BadF/BadG/BcrA/BcrD ATPase family protein [Betaproteobacteria bacterium]